MVLLSVKKKLAWACSPSQYYFVKMSKKVKESTRSGT